MKWTVRILFGLTLLLFVWYLVADRVTPYTSNARIKAVLIEVVPQVSGYVTVLPIANAQVVEAGDLLVGIDKAPFLLAVESAKAALQSATQAVGASSSGIEVTQASLKQAQVNLDNVKVQSARVFELGQKGLVPQTKVDDARAQLAEAESQVASAKADLDRAQIQLGATGEDNPQIQAATAQLGEAQLHLEWTELHAPTRGAIADLTIGVGTFAQAGKSLFTLGSFEDIWVEAYLTENNLGLVKVDQPVEIALDIAPGRLFAGVVSSITPDASAGVSSSGGLARAQDEQAWMRNAQRFPVRIKMVGYEVGSEKADIHRFLNGQADVIVYTGDNRLMNALGAAWIRLNTWLSYAY